MSISNEDLVIIYKLHRDIPNIVEYFKVLKSITLLNSCKINYIPPSIFNNLNESDIQNVISILELKSIYLILDKSKGQYKFDRE